MKTEVHGMYKVKEGIVLNADAQALAEYKKKKESARAKELEIKSIKEELAEIKAILKELVK